MTETLIQGPGTRSSQWATVQHLGVQPEGTGEGCHWDPELVERWDELEAPVKRDSEPRAPLVGYPMVG